MTPDAHEAIVLREIVSIRVPSSIDATHQDRYADHDGKEILRRSRLAKVEKNMLYEYLRSSECRAYDARVKTSSVCNMQSDMSQKQSFGSVKCRIP